MGHHGASWGAHVLRDRMQLSQQSPLSSQPVFGVCVCAVPPLGGGDGVSANQLPVTFGPAPSSPVEREGGSVRCLSQRSNSGLGRGPAAEIRPASQEQSEPVMKWIVWSTKLCTEIRPWQGTFWQHDPRPPCWDHACPYQLAILHK